MGMNVCLILMSNIGGGFGSAVTGGVGRGRVVIIRGFCVVVTITGMLAFVEGVVWRIGGEEVAAV